MSNTDHIKIRVVVITDGKRWIAHGESEISDDDSLSHMEIESDPQWRTKLDRDMICIVNAEIPYKPNRVQRLKGRVSREESDGTKRRGGEAGGKARAAALPASRRSEIARTAARARWGSK